VRDLPKARRQRIMTGVSRILWRALPPEGGGRARLVRGLSKLSEPLAVPLARSVLQRFMK
jgi:hypothetical protein